MEQSFARTGQGSLEYLLLIGGAVVVAAIVVVMIFGFAAGGENQAGSSFDIYRSAVGAMVSIAPTASLPPGGASAYPTNTSISFAANASSGTLPYTYSWDFGDGTPIIPSPTAATTAHAYATVGTYIVTLSITDSTVPPDTVTRTLSIPVSTAPTVTITTPAGSPAQFDISADDLTGDANTFMLSSTATGTLPLTYGWGRLPGSATGSWVSGGGMHSITYRPNGIGTYDFRLIVTDSKGLTATATKSVVVFRTIAASLDSCDATTGWSFTAASTPPAPDSVTKTEGLASLGLGKTTGSPEYSKALTPFDGTNKYFYVWVYITATAKAAIGTNGRLWLYVYKASEWPSNNKFYIGYQGLAAALIADQWNALGGCVLTLDVTNPNHCSIAPGGTPTITALDAIKVGISTNTPADTILAGDIKMDFWHYTPTAGAKTSTREG